MSVAIDDSDTLENPLNCATKERPPTASERIVLTKSPPMAPGVGGPNIPLPPPRLFEGDLAVKEMRRRLSLRPGVLPAPPIRPGRAPLSPWVRALPLMLSVGAFVAICFAAIPEWRRPAGGLQAVLGAISAPDPAQMQPPALERRVVASRRGLANDPLPLGVSLDGQAGGETVILGGLAAGTKLSSGIPLGSTGWRLPGGELAKVLAFAPKDYVGTMDTVIDVRAANDRLMDSQIIRLEWIPKLTAKQGKESQQAEVALTAATVSLDPEELATLLRRGREYLNIGDIASARLVLRRAASAGSGPAAFALGATFDPEVLAELGVLGFAPDVAKARDWYERATALGSPEALRRIERLATWGH